MWDHWILHIEVIRAEQFLESRIEAVLEMSTFVPKTSTTGKPTL
jgi:hypothetical protein